MADTARAAADLMRRYTCAFARAMAPLPQLRRRTRRDMRASLEEYLARNPAAGWDDLVEAFGTPEQAAENVLNGMDASQILAEAQRYSWRRLAAIVVIGLAWAGLALCCGLTFVQLATQPALTAEVSEIELGAFSQTFSDGSSIQIQAHYGEPDLINQSITAQKRYACYENGELVWVYTLRARFALLPDGMRSVMADDRCLIYDEDWQCVERTPGARNNDEAYATAIFRRQSDGREVYPSLTLTMDEDGTLR